MSNWFNWHKRLLLLAALCAVAAAHSQTRYQGIGRAATPEEIQACNIDVRADFKGLPKGKGTVAQGEKIWEDKCASCHGVFGESNQFFNPIIGGTKKSDIDSGKVATLREDYPGRTAMMKLSSLSTLWDYIRRAMPWNAPKSLTVDEVYAVTAYVLHLADVLPADASLSDGNMQEVQGKLPNRKGMTMQHALWPGDEFKGASKPDVQGSSCMKQCGAEAKVVSAIPEYARDAHGNLADQNRLVGTQKGLKTAYTSDSKYSLVKVKKRENDISSESINKLLTQHSCIACHHATQKLVGPSFQNIAVRYQNKADAAGYLSGKIRAGGTGVWGQVAMPPQSLSEDDANTIASWLMQQEHK